MTKNEDAPIKVIDRRTKYLDDPIDPSTVIAFMRDAGKPEAQLRYIQELAQAHKEQFPNVATEEGLTFDTVSADKKPYIVFLMAVRRGEPYYQIMQVRESNYLLLTRKAQDRMYKLFPTNKGYSSQRYEAFELSPRFIYMCNQDLEVKLKEAKQ